jgi:hypothetical protein
MSRPGYGLLALANGNPFIRKLSSVAHPRAVGRRHLRRNDVARRFLRGHPARREYQQHARSHAPNLHRFPG